MQRVAHGVERTAFYSFVLRKLSQPFKGQQRASGGCDRAARRARKLGDALRPRRCENFLGGAQLIA